MIEYGRGWRVSSEHPQGHIRHEHGGKSTVLGLLLPNSTWITDSSLKFDKDPGIAAYKCARRPPSFTFFLSFLASLLHSPKSVTSIAVLQISDHYSRSSFSSTLACRKFFTQTTATMLKLAGIAFVSAVLTQAMALPNSNPASSGLPQNARV